MNVLRRSIHTYVHGIQEATRPKTTTAQQKLSHIATPPLSCWHQRCGQSPFSAHMITDDHHHPQHARESKIAVSSAGPKAGEDLANTALEWVSRSSDNTTNKNDTDNFLQGCQFSPDGLCVLTYTVSDGRLRLYNNNTALSDTATSSITSGQNVSQKHLQDWTTALSIDAGDAVRSYDWYPSMDSSNPATCCFLAAARYVFFLDLVEDGNF